MARGAKAHTPDAELAELAERREKLKFRRDELSTTGTRAKAVLEGAPARRKAAIADEEAGRSPTESLEQIAVAVRLAQAELADADERIEAVRRQEDQIADEQKAVIDANPAYVEAAQLRACEALEAGLRAYLEGANPVVKLMGNASAATNVVRLSRIRQGLPPGPEMGTNDLGGVISELGKVSAYPEGSRARFEQRREQAERERNSPLADASKRGRDFSGATRSPTL